MKSMSAVAAMKAMKAMKSMSAMKSMTTMTAMDKVKSTKWPTKKQLELAKQEEFERDLRMSRRWRGVGAIRNLKFEHWGQYRRPF